MRLLNILLFLYTSTAVLSTVLFRRSLDSSFYLVFEEDGTLEKLKGDLTKYGRSGHATKTNSCGQVRGLPQKLRYSREMYPNGLTQFYQKYTEAYGIPVVSSSRVPDDALKRACYVLRFMMADHSGIRNNFYKRYGRVGVMATTEYTTDIPEHSWLDPVFWNARARGLGATEAWPISTGAEENILCYAKDQYAIEDIFLHEFAHGVHLLGAKYAISGWDARLRYWYNVRKTQGTLWANTYAMSTAEEYFAEGVQSFFDVNAYANPPNGIHNDIDTRYKLKRYDPELYALITEVFPCQNVIIDRCKKSRASEFAHKIKMDCDKDQEPTDEPTEEPTDGPTDNPTDNPTDKPAPCEDKNQYCPDWARKGYCKGQHEDYMEENCEKSCNKCGPDPGPDPDCQDEGQYCGAWAQAGYCNLQSVIAVCKMSCNLC